MTQVLGQENFRFSFVDIPTSANSFYTIALYSWAYGLTDQRKPEFRLSLTVEGTGVPVQILTSSEFDDKIHIEEQTLPVE